MKLVIQTQCRENYGAHDWSGEGECPQHWKMKGGNTYVVENITTKAQAMIADTGIPGLTKLIEDKNESYEEYILGFEIEQDDSAVCEHWETPYVLEYDTDISRWRMTRTSTSGAMRSEILEHMQNWLALPNGGREDYRETFRMTDGAFGIGQDFLKGWLANNKVA